MSEWITDRKPTEEDCKGALGTPYENQVWVNVLNDVVTIDFFHVEAGVFWHPIVIDKPEPYVAPKSKPKYDDGKVCMSQDVEKLKFNHQALTEAHYIAVQALKYIARLYDDSKPLYQFVYDAYAMKSEAATALEKINEVMP